jgi:hypothetical protein
MFLLSSLSGYRVKVVFGIGIVESFFVYYFGAYLFIRSTLFRVGISESELAVSSFRGHEPVRVQFRSMEEYRKENSSRSESMVWKAEWIDKAPDQPFKGKPQWLQ